MRPRCAATDAGRRRLRALCGLSGGARWPPRGARRLRRGVANDGHKQHAQRRARGGGGGEGGGHKQPCSPACPIYCPPSLLPLSLPPRQPRWRGTHHPHPSSNAPLTPALPPLTNKFVALPICSQSPSPGHALMTPEPACPPLPSPGHALMSADPTRPLPPSLGPDRLPPDPPAHHSPPWGLRMTWRHLTLPLPSLESET
eukprot:364545-Chlamydomonas_euryale.AAC.3